MSDNLMSDNPGIVDDTSDGDLGANQGEPRYGSLAESQARDGEGDLTNADINSTSVDGGADGGDPTGDPTGGHDAHVGGGSDREGSTDGDRGAVL